MIDGIDLTVVVNARVCACLCAHVLFEAAICDHKVCCYQGSKQCSSGSLTFQAIEIWTLLLKYGHGQFIGPPTEISVMLLNISL